MATARILTFNFHEPYLCLMAKTGFPITVGLYSRPDFARPWNEAFRPVPPNVTLVEERQWRPELEAGRFDILVAHNERNALDVRHGAVPSILVCHNRRSFLEATATSVDDPREKYTRLLEILGESFEFVFISESKRADYGLPGRVIPPGIDVEDYGGYEGGVPEVLRVGNHMRVRDLMFDVDLQEAACGGLPNRVAGDNPGIPGSRPAASFEELLALYRGRRCLLHVTREEWEDGYNLSMLEAMACGMPVVALANRTSPLTDGVDGLVGADSAALRVHLASLLEDASFAGTLGARGRETVARRFPLDAFVTAWRETLEEVAERRTGRATRKREDQQVQRFPILMQYMSSPHTTARYIAEAARERFDVVTAGFRCPDEVLSMWGFPSPAPDWPAHDIPLEMEAGAGDLLARLPEGLTPGLYLWVDSGPKHAPEGVEKIPVPKVCYLIDTHIAPDIRLDIARHFDVTFLAQAGQVAQFRAAGIPNVFWLPLACSLPLHDIPPAERDCDVAFVGSVDAEADPRRKRLIDTVRGLVPNHVVARCWPEDMARLYNRAKIVVNSAVNRDVNMRVFEAMASGALLITDEADGLPELFEEGRHLVVYHRDEELPELLRYYLDNDAERERIARAGCEEVRANHTYGKRVELLVAQSLDVLGMLGGVHGESRYRRGGYYGASRGDLALQVPATAQRVLDVGCGAGAFGRGLLDRGVAEVVGVELDEQAAAMARNNLTRVLHGNLEQMDLPFEDGYFDAITCGDVLEHLIDPGAALVKLARVLSDDGTIIMSIPNVRFHETLNMLANGRWQYQEAGILDRTHLRFFTAVEIREMVEAAGLELVRMQPLSMIPPDQVPRNPDGSLTIGRVTVRDVTDQEHLEFRVYQYLAIAGKPGRDRLATARRALDEGKNQAAFELARVADGAEPGERHAIMAKASARLERLDTAEKLYRAALETRPGDPRVLAEFGALLVGMNRPGEAAPLLERAIAADSDNARALGALGLARLAEGARTEAFELLLDSLDKDLSNGALAAPLAGLARDLDRRADAVPVLRRFVDFYPGKVDAACLLVQVLLEMGEEEEARGRLEMALLLAPEHEGARALMELLEGDAGEGERAE